MANLLLEKNKKQIFKEFLSRVFVVFLLFIFFTVVVFILLLIPYYFLTISKKTSIYKETKIFEKTIEIRKKSSVSELLNVEKEKIEALKNFGDSDLSKIVSEVANLKPNGIKIIGVFYESTKDGEYLALSGEAENRDILVGYVDSLEEQDDFSSVDFPVSNLVKEESLNFSIKIYIKQKEL